MTPSRSTGARDRTRRGTRARFAAAFGVIAVVVLALSTLGSGAILSPNSSAVSPTANTASSPTVNASSSPNSSAVSPTANTASSPTIDAKSIDGLLAYVRREYWEIYDADRSPGTDDDLTSSKLDLILKGAASTDAALKVQLLGQLTTTILDLSSTAIGAASGERICDAGHTDVTGVAGATELFGEAHPTIGTVVANLIGAWNGHLTNDGRAWSFGYSEAKQMVAVLVLEGMNAGRLITSSGC